MGALLLGERLTVWDGVGGLFIVAGVILVVYGRQRELKEMKLYQELPLSNLKESDIDAVHPATPFYANKQHRSGEVELSSMTNGDSSSHEYSYNKQYAKLSTSKSPATTRSGSSQRSYSSAQSPQSSDDSEANAQKLSGFSDEEAVG
jgi:hypothetical protein